MSDKTLICKDCNAEFIFSEGEQNFYKEKGFMNQPQRCYSCRAAKKQQRRGYSSSSKPNTFGNRMEFKFNSK